MSAALTVGVVLVWVVTAALALGIGSAFLRRLVLLESTWADAFVAILAGFALLFAGLLVWHFFLPANGVALVVFVAIGVLALGDGHRWLRELAVAPRSRLHVVPIVVFTIWAANHALLRGGFDDYSYEFQVVRWYHDYPIVPGLANLHGRLGFNNAQHLYAAMLSVGPLAGAVNVVVNGLFIVLVFARSWSACADLLRNRLSEVTVFTAAFIAPCVARYLVLAELPQPAAATLKADVIGASLAILCAVLWLELVDRSTADSRRPARAVTLAASCAMLFSIRLGTTPFVAVLALASLGWIAARVPSRRVILATSAIVVIVAAAVCVRGVVLTGYPFYPSTVLAADVGWRVPLAQADVERTFITTHAQARATFAVAPPDTDWFLNWLRFSMRTSRITFALPFALIVCLAPLVFLRERRAVHTVHGYGWLVLSQATVGALAVWFIMAPSPRFAWAYWWILFASLAAKTFDRVAPRALAAWPVLAMLIVAGAVVRWFEFGRGEAAGVAWPLLFAGGWSAFWLLAGAGAWRAAGILLIALGAFPLVDRLTADAIHGRTRQMKWILWLDTRQIPRMQLANDFPVVERTTLSGLTVHEGLFSQYETALPATPYFNRYLELRTPGDLSGGFRNASPAPYPLYGYSPDFTGSVPDE